MASEATPVQSEIADRNRDEVMEDATDVEEDESKLDIADYGTQSHINGQHEEYPASPTEPTNYSLFSNPPSVAAMRQRLFDIEDTVEMSPTDFEQYFPFVDNVWRKTRGTSDEVEQGKNTEVYWCRLRKAAGAKPHVPKPTPEGKTPRKKREKPGKTCNMAIKVIYTEGLVKKVTITRCIPKGEAHTHDLEYMDGLKRNGGIMDVARREAIRSFLPTSVFWKMQQEPDKMEAAGGKFMKVSDVRNVQYAWRQENPTLPLKSHTGFNGPRAGFANPRVSRKPRFTPEQSKDRSPSPAPVPFTATPSAPPAQPPPIQQPPPPQYHAPPPLPQYTPQHHVPPPTPLPADTLQYPQHARTFLAPYIPDLDAVRARNRPHVTLSYASSLDGRIAIFPSQRTPLSGPETKAMTHYLRSCHSAILIGVRTAIADDPALNCRLAGASGYGGPPGTYFQPRPVIIDPNARLHIRPEMKLLKAVSEGRAKAPWIVVAPRAQLHPVAVSTLKAHGGEYLQIHDYHPHSGGFNWEGIFNVLFREGIGSIMIEGGGVILSELLKPGYAHLIDSIITTVAPTYLGQQGVEVSQASCVDEHGRLVPTRLKDIRWQPMGDDDVVMCGRIKIQPTHSTQLYAAQKQLQGPAVQQPPQQQQQTRRPGTANGILEGLEEFANTAPPNTNGTVQHYGLPDPVPQQAKPQAEAA